MSFRMMVQCCESAIQDDHPGDECVFPTGSFPQ